MARTKKASTKQTPFTERFSFMRDLREETVRIVIAVLLFVLSAFLVFSALDAAGMLGGYVFFGLSYLFGVGYYLLPLVLFTLGISYFLLLRQEVSVLRLFGALLFFVSGLGMIELFFDGEGGLVGGAIASPLVALVDTYVATLFIGALLLISLIIVLETHLRISLSDVFGKLFEKEERDEYAEEEVCGGEEEKNAPESAGEEEVEDTKNEDAEEELGHKESPTSKIKNIFGLGGGAEEDSLVPSPNFFGEYIHPPLSILEKDRGKPGVGDTKANANIIKRTLLNFGIRVEMDEISVGPTVTRYAMKPAEGVRISRIVSLQSNLELALAASPIRIEAPIPGKSLVGIEVPNTAKTTLGLASLLSSAEYVGSPKPLLTVLGRDITGTPHYADIAKMPHLLVAGTTGSGKSAMIHSIVTSLLYRNGPASLRFIMVDPKRVELTLYNSIPHLLTPVITDPKKAILALKWATKEMERRYNVLEAEAVRDISSYHKNVVEPAKKSALKAGGEHESSDAGLPEEMAYIVLIIDELADLMQAYPRELEASIVRLAQMSRAVGIHIILSTQRPSVNVITGLIKANIPTRIALQMSSQIDSRTILDMSGAEKLLGAGDMLYLSGDMAKPVRIQSPFISEEEVKKVVKHIAGNNDSLPEAGIDFSAQAVGDAALSVSLTDDDGEDDLYEDAREAVLHAGKASTSYLQRKLRVGYSRAARLIDLLEERGVIGAADGAKPREVLYRESGETGAEEYTDENISEQETRY